MSLLLAALAYAAKGWDVFPLNGKIPCEPKGGGFRAATSDPEKIRAWWAKYPRANIGWSLPAGLWVLDVDGEEGKKSRLELERKHEPLPFTLRALTGSGGEHWVFSGSNIRQSAKIVPGLDTRTSGHGYIAIAPSVHPETGKPYRWIADVPVLPSPAWLSKLFEKPPDPLPVICRPVLRTHHEATRRERYALAVLRRLVDEVASCAHGSRNSTLNKAWHRIAAFRDAIERSTAFEALYCAALQCGLSDREARQVLR